MFAVNFDSILMFVEARFNNLPLKANVRGQINVNSYPQKRFVNDEAGKQDISGRMNFILSKSMVMWPIGRPVVCNESKRILAELIKDTLRAESIMADVQVTDFVLDHDSSVRFENAVRDANNLNAANAGMPTVMMMGGSLGGMMGGNGTTTGGIQGGAGMGGADNSMMGVAMMDNGMTGDGSMMGMNGMNGMTGMMNGMMGGMTGGMMGNMLGGNTQSTLGGMVGGMTGAMNGGMPGAVMGGMTGGMVGNMLGGGGFCPNCGAARSANAKFCNECGQKF